MPHNNTSTLPPRLAEHWMLIEEVMEATGLGAHAIYSRGQDGRFTTRQWKTRKLFRKADVEQYLTEGIG